MRSPRKSLACNLAPWPSLTGRKVGVQQATDAGDRAFIEGAIGRLQQAATEAVPSFHPRLPLAAPCDLQVAQGTGIFY